ncbi:hypothetical protein ACFOVU_02295 [Nocardiopsis sediminis]|uniref:Lipoprotein n=1 Tax=Nocardiopsis sediminis TaxID=1778267 RepID=A0ABV8FG10_9ACTN
MDARTTRTLLLTGGAVVILTAAGCGYGNDAGATGDPAPAGEAGDAPAGGGGATEISVDPETSLGSVITDAEGWTLYVFTEDSTEPPTSNCADDCAEQWPPVLAEGEVTANGVEQALFASTQREDGTEQLTIAGWPLYRYAGDAAPGDVNGQAFGDQWYAVTPEGQMVEGTGGGEPAGEAGGGGEAEGGGDTTGGGDGYSGGGY